MDLERDRCTSGHQLRDGVAPRTGEKTANYLRRRGETGGGARRFGGLFGGAKRRASALSNGDIMCTIRRETPEDIPAIHHIQTATFGRPNEADLVERLRNHHALTISLVAVKDGHLVGHIAFSVVTIISSTGAMEALGLAPMAVLPGYQRRGIGSQLVEAGLTACHYTSYGVV